MANDVLGCFMRGIVALCILSNCSGVERLHRQEHKVNNRLDALEQQLTPKIEVVDGRTNQFYEIRNQKAYTMIGNVPVSDYTGIKR